MAFPVFNEAIPDDRKTISYDKLLFFFFFFFSECKGIKILAQPKQPSI